MLLRHTTFNLIGLGAPLLVALVTIPILIPALGVYRFGLLTLVWAVVSYFGLFDLGLGRALTQQLAVALERREHRSTAPLVATATLLMAALGILAGLAMAALAGWGIDQVRSVPDRQEAVGAIYAMAWAMPAIILTSGFRGVLEARHAFGIINLIRVPMGLFTFLGPLAVVLYGEPRLDTITWVLAAGRLAACVVHGYWAWRVLPPDHGPLAVRGDMIGPLCVSGGWLTASNIISPFMGYVDRFVIGALVSVSAVAYYATPYELVTKLWIVPSALTAVLFPQFAALTGAMTGRAWDTLKQSVDGLFALIFPLSLVIALFAEELLRLWIGAEFATHSAVLMQLFAFGILVNCLAHVPLALIQSQGHARLGAIIHCLELPVFLMALGLLTWRYGTLGAALAWLGRILIDAVAMFHFGGAVAGRSFAAEALSAKVLSHALLVGLAFAGVWIDSWPIRAGWILLSLIPLLLLMRQRMQARISPELNRKDTSDA